MDNTNHHLTAYLYESCDNLLAEIILEFNEGNLNSITGKVNHVAVITESDENIELWGIEDPDKNYVNLFVCRDNGSVMAHQSLSQYLLTMTLINRHNFLFKVLVEILDCRKQKILELEDES